MATLTIELPQHQPQTAFNLRRWTEVLADPGLARIEGRIETDRRQRHHRAPDHGAHPRNT